MAVKDGVASNWSLTTQADNRKYSRTDITAPSAPSIVATVSGTTPASEIDLVVTAGVDANSTVVSHNIYRSLTEGGTYSLIASITGTTKTDANLIELTQYWYKATSVNAFGLESSLSAADDATTTSPQGSLNPWTDQDAVAYLPIVPGLRGPGMDTVAGSGRDPTDWGAGAGTTVRKVTSISNSGAGTLRQLITDHNTGSGASTIVFETSGTINFNDTSCIVTRGNLTIFGQTAPSPGIQCINGDLVNRASDVLVQHLTARRKEGTFDADDTFQVRIASGGSDLSGVVIDHATFMWGADETLGVSAASGSGAVQEVTIANSIVAEGMETGYRGMIFTETGEALLYGCLMANCQARQPLTRAKNFAAVNCVGYNWSSRLIDFQNPNSGPYLNTATFNSVVGCAFIRGPNDNSQDPVQTNTPGPVSGSQLYIAGNKEWNGNTDLSTPQTDPGQWALVDINAGTLSQVGAAPWWPDGLVADTSDNARSIVLSYVGARPGQRDTETARLISEVGADSGSLKNAADVTNATYATNTATFNTPANHNNIGASGYTLLEEYVRDNYDTLVL